MLACPNVKLNVVWWLIPEAGSQEKTRNNAVRISASNCCSVAVRVVTLTGIEVAGFHVQMSLVHLTREEFQES